MSCSNVARTSRWFRSWSVRGEGDLIANAVRPDGLHLFSHDSDAVAGQVWLDRNRDGRRSPREWSEAGLTVWADLNNNGLVDRREPRTATLNEGRYFLGNVPFGDVPIRVTGLRKDTRPLTPDRVLTQVSDVLSLVDFAVIHRTPT